MKLRNSQKCLLLLLFIILTFKNAHIHQITILAHQIQPNPELDNQKNHKPHFDYLTLSLDHLNPT